MVLLTTTARALHCGVPRHNHTCIKVFIDLFALRAHPIP